MQYNSQGRPVQVWCISHCDLDGHGAAAIVKQQYPDAKIIITNYNKHIRMDQFRAEDIVFVTDFSLNIEGFRILSNRRCRIIWIDHHVSAIESLRAEGWNCEGIRRTDYSGTALTWMYFNKDKTFDQAPYFVKLINWYDLWQHDKDPNIRPFQYGVGLWDTRPGFIAGDKFWKDMFSNEKGDKLVENIINHGKIIMSYNEKYQSLLCDDLAYETSLNVVDGSTKKIMAMAVRSANSSVFEKMDLSQVDATFTGQFVAGDMCKYRCSMYSPDGVKNILDIVKGFGGGGHPTAAGFAFPVYPLNYPEPKQPTQLAMVVAKYDELLKIRRSSPVLLKYADRNNSITAKVSGWMSNIEGIKCVAFNHHYIPEMLHMLPTSIECLDPNTGDIADLYIGYVMTNSGFFRCCACPTSTSVDMDKVLQKLQAAYMKKLTSDVYNLKVIGNNIWWYATEPPVSLPVPPTQTGNCYTGK